MQKVGDKDFVSEMKRVEKYTDLHIYGAKFQEHCFNISRDIVYSVFYNF